MSAQDILYKQDGPTTSLQVHSGPVHCLAAHQAGQLVLAGCEDGRVALLHLADSLTNITRQERVGAWLGLLHSDNQFVNQIGD